MEIKDESKKLDILTTPILPSTKRMMVMCLGLGLVACISGMAWGKIPVNAGMLLCTSISSGFIGLLRS